MPRFRRRRSGSMPTLASTGAGPVATTRSLPPCRGRRFRSKAVSSPGSISASTITSFAPPISRGSTGGRDGIVVPIAADGPADWALVLLGSVPAESEVTLEALGRVLGVQMERLAFGRSRSDPRAIPGDRRPGRTRRRAHRDGCSARPRRTDVRLRRRTLGDARRRCSPDGRGWRGHEPGRARHAGSTVGRDAASADDLARREPHRATRAAHHRGCAL